jgi:hypothetical protein
MYVTREDFRRRILDAELRAMLNARWPQFLENLELDAIDEEAAGWDWDDNELRRAEEE